jgi:hypothetical protein
MERAMARAARAIAMAMRIVINKKGDDKGSKSSGDGNEGGRR